MKSKSVPTPSPVDELRRGYTDEEKQQARGRIAEAFGVAGLVGGDGNPTCPACGTSARKKVALKPTYWSCRRCKAWGNAVDVLVEHRGYRVADAFAVLLGDRPPQDRAASTPTTLTVSTQTASVVDKEVYRRLVGAGSPERAAEFYGQFGVAAKAVSALGFVWLYDSRESARILLEKAVEAFGEQRLAACGVLGSRDDGSLYSPVIDHRYPVLEVHRDADGDPVGLQARAAGAQAAKVAAHKAWKQAKSAAEASGSEPPPKQPYVPGMLSLYGGGPDHLVGIGLHLIAGTPPGRVVFIVEGGKDCAAALTLLDGTGALAYGLPGAGNVPPDPAMEALARHTVVVAFDGDDAGRDGAARVGSYLTDAGIMVWNHMPDGRDVADLAAARI